MLVVHDAAVPRRRHIVPPLTVIYHAVTRRDSFVAATPARCQHIAPILDCLRLAYLLPSASARDRGLFMHARVLYRTVLQVCSCFKYASDTNEGPPNNACDMIRRNMI